MEAELRNLRTFTTVRVRHFDVDDYERYIDSTTRLSGLPGVWDSDLRGNIYEGLIIGSTAAEEDVWAYAVKNHGGEVLTMDSDITGGKLLPVAPEVVCGARKTVRPTQMIELGCDGSQCALLVSRRARKDWPGQASQPDIQFISFATIEEVIKWKPEIEGATLEGQLRSIYHVLLSEQKMKAQLGDFWL